MKRILLASILILSVFTTTYARSYVNYQGEVSTAFGTSVCDYKYQNFTLETTHGVRFYPYFFVGGGMNVNLFIDDYSSEWGTANLFTNFRVYLPTSNERIFPYASINLGYSIGLDYWDDLDGFYYAPAVGVHFELGNRLGLTASVSFEGQRLGYYDDYYYGHNHGRNYRYDYDLNSVVFRIGLIF